MRVILHIGTEKTGTTSIQRFLVQNSDRLKNSGILYPISLRPYPEHINHLSLTAAARREGVEDDIVREAGMSGRNRNEERKHLSEKLGREIKSANAKQVLISSEHLSSRLQCSDEIENVRTILHQAGCFDIYVCVYLRDQLTFLRSWYSTAVRSGERRLLSDIPFSYLRLYLDLLGLLRRWELIFGEDRVNVYSYGEAKSQGLLAHFVSSAGVPGGLEESSMGKIFNASIDGAHLEILRRLNGWLEGPEFEKKRRYLADSFERLSTGPAVVIPAELEAKIVDTFSEDNRRIEEKYFLGRRVLAFAPMKD